MKYNYKEYHKKQYEEVCRSTLSLMNFIQRHIACEEVYKVLDIGCRGVLTFII